MAVTRGDETWMRYLTDPPARLYTRVYIYVYIYPYILLSFFGLLLGLATSRPRVQVPTETLEYTKFQSSEIWKATTSLGTNIET